MMRMIEASRHARLISRTSPLAGFVTGAELAPGPAISGDSAALASSIRETRRLLRPPGGNLRDGPRSRRRRRRRRLRGGPRGRLALGGGRLGHATIPAANTNLSTIVIAEHIAQGLIAI
jgi:hypothetical protein